MSHTTETVHVFSNGWRLMRQLTLGGVYWWKSPDGNQAIHDRGYHAIGLTVAEELEKHDRRRRELQKANTEEVERRREAERRFVALRDDVSECLELACEHTDGGDEEFDEIAKGLYSAIQRAHAPNERVWEGHDHPGYIIGVHWLSSAYDRICAGEPELEVLADFGYYRADERNTKPSEVPPPSASRAGWYRDALEMAWLIDNAIYAPPSSPSLSTVLTCEPEPAPPAPSPPGPREGDIVLVRSESWISRLIRFFTRSPGEPRTRCSHVAMILNPGVDASQSDIIEAAPKGVEINRLDRHSGNQVAIYRPIFASPADRAAATHRALEMYGRSYPVWRLVAHLLDWLVGLCGAIDVRLCRRVGRSLDQMECSALVAWAYEPYLSFGSEWWAVSPDDMDDYITEHPKQFQEIRPWSLLEVGDA